MNSDPVTSTDVGGAKSVLPGPAEVTRAADGAPRTDAEAPDIAAWLCGILQANDSFYPTGSYSHSFGLEGLIHEGVVHDRSTLRSFVLLSALPMLERAELPIVAHAWRALATARWDRMAELSVLSSALKASRESREASEKIGRQRAELAAALHGGIAQAYLAHALHDAWPFASSISLAVEAHAVGAPCRAAMSACAYSGIAALLAAAMKLLRLGQNGAQSLLSEALAQVPQRISRAEHVAFDEIGWFNPWLDIASARHELADARMFIS